MAPRTNKLEGGELLESRKAAGRWLREARERAGISQRELAVRVGLEYYTFISQLESGRGRVPTDRYADYAKALHIEPREFAMAMMKFNDPSLYEILFGEAPIKQVTPPSVVELEERLRLLEARLK